MIKENAELIKTKIFISYSYDEPQHEQWVQEIADYLEEFKEFHIIFDKYDLNTARDINYFMEKGIYGSDVILVICTKEYAKKANDRSGGVGIETFMNADKHWSDMGNTGISKTIAILKDSKEVSIPNYLKGKLYISFENEKNHADSLKRLVKEIEEIHNKTSRRPRKNKSVKDKPINYFKFDRVDDILAINYKKRQRINKETNFRRKNKIKYEFWKITNFNSHIYILILFNNINIKETINSFISKNESLPSDLIIIKAIQSEGYIKKIFLEKSIAINIKDYTLEQFFWDECLDQEWKNENTIMEEKFFIDQRIYKKINSVNETIGLSVDYVENKFLSNDNEKSILMLFASGGMGKSTLSKILTNKINKKEKRKSLLIQAETIRSNIKKDAVKNFEIKNLYQLYDIYSKMISENKSLLTKQQFELGILTGKIVVIIDGLDEIVSLFHSNFNLKEFLNSLKELNLQLGKTKVIITARRNILQNNSYLELDNNIDIIYLKGFEQDIWTRYIEKRFSKYQNIKQYKNKMIGYITSLLSSNSGQQEENIILPFFLDLMSVIVEDEVTKEDGHFIISEIKNKYYSNNENIDYLIFSILKREILRQQFNISIEKFINFFKELSSDYSSKIPLNELKEFIEYYFDSNDTDDIYQKILLNPLLSINIDSKIASFKYDFLGNYFNALYLFEYLHKTEFKTLDETAIKHLSKMYNGSNAIFIEVVKHFKNYTEECMVSSRKIIELISDEIRKSDKKNIRLKRVISSLLYLTQNIHGINLEGSERIDIIKELYNNEKISYLYIWGDFYKLDFSNLSVWHSEFHEYNLFCKSKFYKTKFYHSLFSNIETDVKCTAKKDNFEMDSCTLDSLQYYLDESENNENRKIEILEQYFLAFLKNFFDGIKFQAKLYENITVSSKLLSIKKDFRHSLISINFLKKKDGMSKNFYEIDKSYHYDIQNFWTNNHISPKLKELFNKVI